MLSKSQQVFASAHKDIQRLTWNFRSENLTKKMLLRSKQQTCSRKVVKLKRCQFTGIGHAHLRISQDICHVRMTDIEGFLTIYGHSDNLLNNNQPYFNWIHIVQQLAY